MRAPASPVFLSLPWHVLPRHAACLALLTPLLLQAQPQLGVYAASPDSATAPLIHPGVTPLSPIADVSPSPLAWREGNEAVADFPRGHADIVAWEARRGAQPTPPPAPHGAHSSDQGAKPPGHSHHPKHGGTQ